MLHRTPSEELQVRGVAVRKFIIGHSLLINHFSVSISCKTFLIFTPAKSLRIFTLCELNQCRTVKIHVRNDVLDVIIHFLSGLSRNVLREFLDEERSESRNLGERIGRQASYVDVVMIHYYLYVKIY